MKDRIWETEFESHTIRVINQNSFLPPFTGEVLEIDGEVVDEIRGDIFRMFSTLTGKLEIDGVERKIETRLATKSDSPRTGCQIFVDGVQVGGDYSIRYPDPKIMDGYAKKGFINYFLRRGLFRLGLPYLVLLLLFFRNDQISDLFIKSILFTFLLVLTTSFMNWRGIKSRTEHIAKLQLGESGINQDKNAGG
ncbi:MAG: hypothetical protein K9M19_07605 [Candidatus Marinimicrobia bacterium]|nr:hypothetical protein [Candidatus Neomarinimicrobiota bacterium]